ncbi:MAG: acyltransferase [Bacteroidales bacterium]|jgi:hypothetical protein|nr:acyltransferase [Bacteroidales bacterium]
MEVKNKIYLNDVLLIRPIIILLLLVHHIFGYNAFSAHPIPKGVHIVPFYSWISSIPYSFFLEMFVFVSGYIFAFQIFAKNKNFSIKTLTISKFNRLIIPSIVFSILWLVIFQSPGLQFGSIESFSIKCVYYIFNGCGHMWFLPMLFWCFIFSFLLLKLKIDERLKLIGLLGLSIISFAIPPIFQISKACYYLLFFYGAIYIERERKGFQKIDKTNSYDCMLDIIFTVVFI